MSVSSLIVTVFLVRGLERVLHFTGLCSYAVSWSNIFGANTAYMWT